MAINRLFMFVKNNLDIISSKRKIQLNRNIEGRSYFLCQLPIAQPLVLQDGKTSYELDSHHISIYEDQASPSKTGQYHYTAYFHDKDKFHYQLHLYFDNNDQLTTSAQFSIAVGNHEYNRTTISENFDSTLTHVGIDNTMHFMAELRGKQHTFLSDLISQYNQLEQKLTELSSSLPQEMNEYNNYLGKTIASLESLIQYSDDSLYGSLLQLFYKINLFYNSTSTASTASSQKIEKDIEKKESTPSSSPTSMSKTKVEKKSIQNEIKEATETKNAFLRSIGNKLTKQFTYFIKFEEAVRHLVSLTIFEEFDYSAIDLQKIQNLFSVVRVEGQKLIEKLLFNGQYDLASKLAHLLDPAPEHLVRKALQSKNHKLLDFLLSSGSFPINTFIVSDHLTPVLFCLGQKNIAECFSVLVKHNASIMVKASDGLPVAYHILKTIDHPLRKALFDTEEKITVRPRMYNDLIIQLRLHLANNKLDQSVKDNLLNAIDTYKLLISNDVSLKLSPSMKEDKEQLIAETVKQGIISSEQVDKYRFDKEVNNEFRKVQQAAKNVLKLLSPSQRRRAVFSENMRMESLIELAKMSNASFQFTKEKIIATYRDLTTYFELQANYVELSKTKTHSLKAYQQLKQRREAIGLQLKEYNSKYWYLQMGNISATSTNEKEILDALQRYSFLTNSTPSSGISFQSDDRETEEALNFNRQLELRLAELTFDYAFKSMGASTLASIGKDNATTNEMPNAGVEDIDATAAESSLDAALEDLKEFTEESGAPNKNPDSANAPSRLHHY